MKKLLLLAACILSAATLGAQRYVGGDISSLPSMEKAGAQYKTHDGAPIADLIPYLAGQGMNAMRVRLFVNPDDYTGADKDPNCEQTLEYITPLCKRIKDAGLDLLLDFHYSDTWADPAKQYTPKAWKDLTDEQLFQKIYDYTKDCLIKLEAAGVTPDFIQPGNEISYGMLWGPEGTAAADQKKCLSGSSANWNRFGALLRNAIKACREVCPKAKIIIHTERVANVKVQKNFYDWMKALGVDYDIIGLSYYPYFHGKLNVLETAIADLEKNYPDKNIMVVETGYPLKWEIPGTDKEVDYPYTDAGQNRFVADLVEMLLKHPKVDGLFWWWLEYNAKGTSLSGWYNAPLFDSETGRATSALKTLCSFAADSGIDAVESDSHEIAARWFDLQGIPAAIPADAPDQQPSAPGLYISKRGKILVR